MQYVLRCTDTGLRFSDAASHCREILPQERDIHLHLIYFCCEGALKSSYSLQHLRPLCCMAILPRKFGGAIFGLLLVTLMSIFGQLLRHSRGFVWWRHVPPRPRSPQASMWVRKITDTRSGWYTEYLARGAPPTRVLLSHSPGHAHCSLNYLVGYPSVQGCLALVYIISFTVLAASASVLQTSDTKNIRDTRNRKIHAKLWADFSQCYTGVAARQEILTLWQNKKLQFLGRHRPR